MGQGRVGGGAARVEASRALRQLERVWPVLAAGSAVVLLALALVHALSVRQGIPEGYFTGDPTAMLGARWWVGLLSTLGIMLWAAATGICALGVYVLNEIAPARRVVPFLVASTVLCLVLALDDAYRLHEDVLPAFLHVPEPLIMGLYAASALGYVTYFWRIIRNTDYLVLFVALLCLAASALIDLFPWATLLEDTYKLAGIVFLLLYCARTTALLVREAFRRAGRFPGR